MLWKLMGKRLHSPRRLTHRNHPSLRVERLEERCLLDAGLTNGIWRILGTPVADTLVVDRDPAQANKLRAFVNGILVDTQPESRVQGIRIEGAAGNDTLRIDASHGTIALPTTLLGGSGKDTIAGGAGRDWIYGGTGDDSQSGGAGDDVLIGNGTVGNPAEFPPETDNDILDGGLGENLLNGSGGNDVLSDGEQIARPSSFGTATAFVQYLRDSALERYKDLFGKRFPSYYPPGPIFTTDTAVPGAAGGAVDLAPASNGSFSQTNIQVPGVDEADIVKTDGHSIYLLSRQELVIFKAGTGYELRIVARTALEGFASAQYLNGDRLTVISTIYTNTVTPQGPLQGPLVGIAADSLSIYPLPSKVKVTVFDVSDRTAPRVVQATYLDGTYVTSRAIGNQVYAVVQNSFTGLPAPAYTFFNNESVYETKEQYLARITGHELDLTLPHFYTRTGAADSPLQPAGFVSDPARIYKPSSANDYNLTSVLAFDVTSTSSTPIESASVLSSYASTVYASTDHLYVVLPYWSTTTWSSTTTSSILQFQLNGGHVDLAAVGEVPGQVLNQFSLDEQGRYLRLTTTANWGPNASNNLYVLANEAGTLNPVGSLERLAPGEQIRSTRFLGERGFLVTFRQIDPLFALDLTDPSAPRVVGELHLPGFSSYLQPIDANHLLGIGRADGGQGLKLSLFDIANLSNPREVAQYVVAPRNWNWWWGTGSEAEWDHHAVGYFAEFQTLAIPVYGSYVGLNYTGYQSSLWVFQVDGTNGFHLLGQIDHDSQVRRSLRIGDRLYSVAEDSLAVRPIQDPQAPGTEVRIHDEPRLPEYTEITSVKDKEFSGPLLTFTVTDVTDLQATINWGDGQTSDGTIGQHADWLGRGRFFVLGTHTYTQAGHFYPSITFSRAEEQLSTLYASIKVYDIEPSHHRFLTQVYADLLQRAVDPVGLVAWGSLLQSGTSPATIVAEIASSSEYRTHVIQDVYQSYLGRAAEDAGLASWLEYLATGQTTDELRAAILASPEYLAQHGHSNDQFLRALYQDVLHRDIDATGARIWGQFLTLRTSRAAVAEAVVRSLEAQTDTVRDLYTHYLGRDSEEAGLRHFVTGLQQGRRQEDVLAEIVGSEEYTDRL